MSSGPWIPVPKTITSQLPKDRPFSWVEAFLSLAIDSDNCVQVTIKGYADLWQWSRGRVERFLEEVGVAIEYPEETSKKQNQRGQIMIQMTSRKRTDNGQIKVIDLNMLNGMADRERTEDEQKTSRSQSTTIKTKTKTKKKPLPTEDPPGDFGLFKSWWMYAFETLEGYQYPFGSRDGKSISEMLKVAGLKVLVCKACHYLVDPKRFPPEKAPTLHALAYAIADYHGEVKDKVDEFRRKGILPSEGTLLVDWKPWEKSGDR